MMKSFSKEKGFTLLEILLVVAAIAILAGIVIIAINPSKQLGETRNAQRSTDVNTILNALHQYSIDNNGSFPLGLDWATTTAQMLGTSSSCDSCSATTTAASCVDFTSDLVPTYITGIPVDPAGSSSTSQYFVNRYGNRLVVGACSPEQDASIIISR